MKMKRSIILVLISALLSANLVYAAGIDATSASKDSGVVKYEYADCVNPLYEGMTDIATGEVVMPVAYSNSLQFSDYNEMVMHIRETMLARKTNDVFTYKGSRYGMEATEFVKKAIADAYADDDNSIPDEGDYLLYSYRGCSFSVQSLGDEFTADITFQYMSTADEEEQVTEAVNTLISSWDVSSLTDMQKVRLVHDYIVTNVTYDYELDKHSAYNALIEGTAVCQGYALLTQRLLRELGIKVRIVTGIGNTQKHAWNIVKIGDKYYNIDCTWDSNCSSYDSSAQRWNIDYSYYLLSDDDFLDHTRDEKYLTEEFVSTHPVYTQSYFEDTMLNVNAGSYSFNSTSDSGVYNSEEEITILVMGNMTNSGSTNVLESIAQKGVEYTDGVRVIAVDISQNRKSTVLQKISPISSAITACYDTSTTSKRTMFDLAEKADLLNDDSTVNIPVVLVIDSDSIIRYAYTGSAVSGGRLLNCIYNINPEQRPAEPPVSTPVPTVCPTNAAEDNPDESHEPAVHTTEQPKEQATVCPTGLPVGNLNIPTQKTPDINNMEPANSVKNKIKPGESFNVSGIRYKVTSASSGKYTVKCMGAVKKNIRKLIIPALVKYKSKLFKVTVINTGAFMNNKWIRRLTIGSNVVTIKNKAFYKCSNIKKIIIVGKKLKNIGKKSFSGYSKKDLLR